MGIINIISGFMYLTFFGCEVDITVSGYWIGVICDDFVWYHWEIFINVSFLVTWGFICFLLFIYFLIVLGIEPRTLHVLGKCSITNLHLTHKWRFSNLQKFIPLNSDENLFSMSHSVLHWKTKRNKRISLTLSLF